jgi:hypothetical protein
MVKFFTKSACIALISTLCVVNLNAQLVPQKAPDSDVSFTPVAAGFTATPSGAVTFPNVFTGNSRGDNAPLLYSTKVVSGAGGVHKTTVGDCNQLGEQLSTITSIF